MKCKILGIREPKPGLRIAHVQAGTMFGDVPCNRSFQEAQVGDIRPNLRVRQGRLEAYLLLENLPSDQI